MKVLSRKMSINADRIIEDHSFANPGEIMDIGNDRQWMLKSLSERLLGNFIMNGSG